MQAALPRSQMVDDVLNTYEALFPRSVLPRFCRFVFWAAIVVAAVGQKNVALASNCPQLYQMYQNAPKKLPLEGNLNN
jgi:hypothetical protein